MKASSPLVYATKREPGVVLAPHVFLNERRWVPGLLRIESGVARDDDVGRLATAFVA